jgi:hypothetical protein
LNYLGAPLPQSVAPDNGVTATAPGQTLTAKKGVNNYLIGHGKGSTLIGGGGNDTFYVRDASDKVVVPPGGGVSSVVSWAGYYGLPPNARNLILQSANGGTGVGNDLDNLLVAQGSAKYTLVAGTGNDVFIGNDSRDPGRATTFVLVKGGGKDVISNFVNGNDLVRLVNYSQLAGFEAVRSAMTQVGPDVVLHLGQGETLTFRNKTIAAFTAGDFALPAYLRGMILRYSDDFSSFTSSPDGSRGWMTTGGAGWRTLESNHEAEYYSDPSVGVDPFSHAGGVLTITATPGSNPLHLPYNSGIITTQKTFAAKYGLFQVSARMPAGAGLWPAIWLLPVDLSWPPEIDMMEGLQDRTNEIHVGANTKIDGKLTGKGDWVYVGDTTGAFHMYGVDWEPDRVTWYFDGNTIYSEDTFPGTDKPMYLLINLAVGGAGSWPGPPTSARTFPARMQVNGAWFHASPNTVEISGTSVREASPAVTIRGAIPEPN